MAPGHEARLIATVLTPTLRELGLHKAAPDLRDHHDQRHHHPRHHPPAHHGQPLHVSSVRAVPMSSGAEMHRYPGDMSIMTESTP